MLQRNKNEENEHALRILYIQQHRDSKNIRKVKKDTFIAANSLKKKRNIA